MWKKVLSNSAFTFVYQQQSKALRDISWRCWRKAGGDNNGGSLLNCQFSSVFIQTGQGQLSRRLSTYSLRYFGNLASEGGSLKGSVFSRNFYGKGFQTWKISQQPQRCFRTTSKNNALPPVIVLILGRVAKYGAVLFGRMFRRWWQKLPPEERAKYAAKVRRNRYLTSGVLGAMAFGSFVYYDSHVQIAPFTERKRFLAFNNEQIIAMSKLEFETHLELNQKNIIPATSGRHVYQRIVRVCQQLLKGNESLPQLKGLDWTITVVDSDETINAFVLPCGSIFVFSGLLKLCDSDDQLGIILAHEMSHAVMGHGAEKASLLHLLDLLFVIPLAAIWAFLPTDLVAALSHWITATLSEILMELPHSRFIEEEADMVGLILAAQACFDIREAPVVWAKIALMEQDNISIEWLSTHPSHEKRQAQLEGMLSNAISHREKCQCPRLPLFDPRLKIKAYKDEAEKHRKQRFENLAVAVKV